MWIKAQNGELYNADTFSAFRMEVRNEITHVLYGVDKNKVTRTELLKYSSFKERNFIDIARNRIETGIRNRWSLCDLSNICRVDYTAEEFEYNK